MGASFQASWLSPEKAEESPGAGEMSMLFDATGLVLMVF